MAPNPPVRPIRRLLVANRGEIATRIISSARELGLETYAVYTTGDASHALHAAQAIELSSAASYMDKTALIDLVKKHEIDAVHPGYGFLSESDGFSRRMFEEAGAIVVGPGWEILAKTGDKLKARRLADECHVPVAPALQVPTNNVEDVRRFASDIGFPIMVKAVDGGGGRGIRLIRDHDSLAGAVKRAVEESPSKQVFAEKAAVDGFRHVEIQVIGDSHGNVTHLWERECSIQRRYQKIVEFAPSLVSDRALIASVIQDALRMARQIKYFSLGTFEFLVNPITKVYYFLEVNPRLQVEHTITETVTMHDIVKSQLLLAQGATLSESGIRDVIREPETPPPAHSIQLRITAEDTSNNWSLSIGKITSFQFPTGNGIRTDTHLSSGRTSIVSADFDSLIAKLIVTAPTWGDAVRKAQRALEDTQVSGVKTNLQILRAIVSHEDFLHGRCSTQWLEQNQNQLLELGHKLISSRPSPFGQQEARLSSSMASVTSSSTLFRKGDAWSIALSNPNVTKGSNGGNSAPPHHLELTRVVRNEFPASLVADILFTAPSTSSGSKPKTTPYSITISSTTASAAQATSHHRKGNSSDPSHVNIPFPGKLIEVLVDEGDLVREGEVICVVQQMKMELEIRSHRSGRITWVTNADDGEDVAEGTLAAIVEETRDAKL